MNLFTILRNQKIIELNRIELEEQKINDQLETAATCSANWTIDGSLGAR
jgi:hypothetical protein